MIVYNNDPNGQPISNSYFELCIYTVRESTHSSSIGVLTSLLTTSLTYGRAESVAHELQSSKFTKILGICSLVYFCHSMLWKAIYENVSIKI